MVKKRIDVTVEEEKIKSFDKIAPKLGIKRSPWIESKIDEFIKEHQHLLEGEHEREI